MWFKVDDGFHSSRKLLSIPKRHRLAAAGLWAVAGSWCGDQLTDGHVPDYMIKEWGGTPALVDALLNSGLWERASDASVFYKWHEYQPSKQDVDAERATSRERMRDLRARRKQGKPHDSGAKDDAFTRTVTNGSEYVSNPDPTRPDPVAKATDREASQAPPKPAKGSRIPDDWMPSNDLIATMSTECPSIDQQAEHRAFMDHWKAQPGANGTKADWPATYRNWIRRAAKFAPQQQMTASDRRLEQGKGIIQRAARLTEQTNPFMKELT